VRTLRQVAVPRLAPIEAPSLFAESLCRPYLVFSSSFGSHFLFNYSHVCIKTDLRSNVVLHSVLIITHLAREIMNPLGRAPGQPAGPVLNFNPALLVLPNIPPEEEDPRVRINVMIDIFNKELKPAGPVDEGFLNEIWTAKELVHAGRISSGRQISRRRTKQEISEELPGHSQMIVVPLGNGKFREIDMLCDIDGTSYIVEAKLTAKSDLRQLRPNVALAQQIGGGVMYAFGGWSEKKGQEAALRGRYEKLPEARTLPPLQVLHVQIANRMVHTGTSYSEIIPIVTEDDELSRQALEYDFNEYKISFGDLGYWKARLVEAEKAWEIRGGDRPKYSGWAAEALAE
jgi:hypothetical protein